MEYIQMVMDAIKQYPLLAIIPVVFYTNLKVQSAMLMRDVKNKYKHRTFSYIDTKISKMIKGIVDKMNKTIKDEEIVCNTTKSSCIYSEVQLRQELYIYETLLVSIFHEVKRDIKTLISENGYHDLNESERNKLLTDKAYNIYDDVTKEMMYRSYTLAPFIAKHVGYGYSGEQATEILIDIINTSFKNEERSAIEISKIKKKSWYKTIGNIEKEIFNGGGE